MSYRNRAFGICGCILLLAATGCVSPYTYYGDGSCGGPGLLSGRYCDQGCGDCMGSGCADCGSCGTSACTTCEGYTPIGALREGTSCAAGCGDVYLGEWSYDPPDECDSCGDHGEWTGPHCCPPKGLSLLWFGLWGQRCDGCAIDSGCGMDCDCGANGGCADCGSEQDTIYETGPGSFEETYQDIEGSPYLESDLSQVEEPSRPAASGPNVRRFPWVGRTPSSADRRSTDPAPDSRLLQRPRR